MFLIDKGGKRVRPVCRECRKVHGKATCPRRRSRRCGDRLFAAALAVQESLRQQRRAV